MKTRYVVLFVFLVSSIGLFTGCEEVAQVQTPIEFAQLRIANFNTTCSYPQVYDVYIYPVGQPSAIPTVRGGLSYGKVTPWIDNLPTNREAGMTYTVDVRIAGSTEPVVAKEITLKPGDRYTLWLFKFDNTASAAANTDFISDKQTFAPDPTKAYFRFLNTEQETSPLTIKVGDPIGGTPVGETSGEAVDYKKYSDYTGYPATSVDATITFFVVDGQNNVVGRIAGVALEGGTYKTITWGGNCEGRYLPQDDPTAPRPDSHHVRILDDAGDGADETTPVPQTLRYFFVNALIPPADASLKSIYGYDQLGVVVNNDNRYNFGPLSPYIASPSVGASPEGVISVVPSSTLLTDAINVKGFVYNAANPTARGMLLFDYRAGERASIRSDELVAFVVSDTVRNRYVLGSKHPLDSSQGNYIFTIPDAPKQAEATFVIANMLVQRGSTSANRISFWIDGDSVEAVASLPRKEQATIHIQPGVVNFTAKMNLGSGESTSFPTFKAEAGGIYLVLVVGRRQSVTPQDFPRIMVIRTNP